MYIDNTKHYGGENVLSFTNAFLTPKQLRAWDLYRSNLRQTTIAKRMKVSRQAVSQTLSQATKKMTQVLLEAAKLHNLRIDDIDAKEGFVTGYNPQIKTHITILFTVQHGLQTWYHHEATECASCDEFETCVDTLMTEAVRRGIEFSEEESSQPPSKIAKLIFSRIMSDPTYEEGIK